MKKVKKLKKKKIKKLRKNLMKFQEKFDEVLGKI